MPESSKAAEKEALKQEPKMKMCLQERRVSHAAVAPSPPPSVMRTLDRYSWDWILWSPATTSAYEGRTLPDEVPALGPACEALPLCVP